MIRPFDVFARAAAAPRIALSATASMIDARRRFTAAFAGDPDGSAFAARFFDGFFDRVEQQCRGRWCEVFVRDEDAGDDMNEAA